MTPNNIPDSDLEKTPLAERTTEVYWLRIRDTGLGQEQARTVRSELESRVAECLNHFQSKAPGQVAQLERTLERYDRLRDAAGINRRLLEEPSKLLPGVEAREAPNRNVLGALDAGK